MGYGVDASGFNWNDYANMDVTGKVLLILVNEPQSENGIFNQCSTPALDILLRAIRLHAPTFFMNEFTLHFYDTSAKASLTSP